MKQPQNPRRGRSRTGPGKRHQPSKNRNFESGGGEAKVRGNAQQILDKYQAMARDAASAGEHILAEGYWQHAEHYHRILNADREDRAANRENNAVQNENNGSKNASGAGNAPRNEQATTREIPIKSQNVNRDETRKPAPAENNPEGRRVARDKPAEPMRLAEPVAVEAIAEPAAVPVPEQATEPAAPAVEKPKRRGRPRKAAVDADTATESPSTDPSPETASA